jgi:hypothetical protein
MLSALSSKGSRLPTATKTAQNGAAATDAADHRVRLRRVRHRRRPPRPVSVAGVLVAVVPDRRSARMDVLRAVTTE